MPHCDFVENRSQGRMTALAPSLLAAGFYISGILYQLHCLGKRLAVNASLLRAIGLVALLAHAVSLYIQLTTPQGFALGLFNIASLISWLVVAMTLASSFRAPVTSLLLGLYPLALITGLLAGFFALIGWSIVEGLRNRHDPLAGEVDQELAARAMPLGRAVFWLVAGFLLLIVSSRVLVYGAVSIAGALGISELVIGLTIVALGTSLPELAASVIAARRGEHDIAIGNVVGSNMFNLLAVIGIAGTINPLSSIAPEVLYRDWLTMIGLTLLLLAMAFGFVGQGRINRLEGLALLGCYSAYTTWLVLQATGQ